MGLQGVELFMAIEDDFGVKFSDTEARRIVTVMDLYNVVLDKLFPARNAVDHKQVWNRLVQIITTELQIEPDRVTPEAKIWDDLCK